MFGYCRVGFGGVFVWDVLSEFWLLIIVCLFGGGGCVLGNFFQGKVFCFVFNLKAMFKMSSTVY